MSIKASERTKVVVRSLPPLLGAEAFKEVIDKHADGSYNWWSYFPGKARCGTRGGGTGQTTHGA